MNSHVELPSNKKFGYFFSFIFFAAFIYCYHLNNLFLSTISISFGLCFFIATIFRPNTLGTLNRLWFKVGVILSGIVSPIILGAIFFLVIAPIALILRLKGRDELSLKKKYSNSYWVDRPKDSKNLFKNQF